MSPVQPKKDNGGSSEELTVLSQEVLRLKAELEHTNKVRVLEMAFNTLICRVLFLRAYYLS